MPTTEGTTNLYDIKVSAIDGSETALSAYKGKVLLIVNVASKCGLTPQYDGLEKLYKQYKGKGLEVLGFPANDFAGQEPGSNQEIQEFCRSTYGVEFPMFSKITVKGQQKHPLYDALINQHPQLSGAVDTGTKAEVSWNFEKFLVDRTGKVVERFSPKMVPDDATIVQAIEKYLASK